MTPGRPTSLAIGALALCIGCASPDPSSAPQDPHLLPLAPGMDIAWVATYQPHERVLHGADFSPQVGAAPELIAGRDLEVRVGVERQDGVPARDIAVVLQARQGSKGATNYLLAGPVPKPHADRPESTFNFTIPAEHVSPRLELAVSLRDLIPRVNYPGSAGTSSWTSELLIGAPTSDLHLVLVPIAVDDGDDVHRPDVSDAQLELYRHALSEQFPVGDVHIAVTEGFVFNGTFQQSDWIAMLNRVTDHRAWEDPEEPNTYFHGLIAPPSDHPGVAGTAGLGNLAESPNDDWARASIGIGYPGMDSVNTLVHEVGHTHGRRHVDCGDPDAIDPNYPHDPAELGVRAWPQGTDEIIGPTNRADFMSYCSPSFVSDYTFEALWERILAVDATSRSARQPLSRGFVRPDGSGVLSGVVRGLPGTDSQRVEVQLTDETGRRQLSEGWLFAVDHGGGAMLLVPHIPGAWAVEVLDWGQASLAP